MTSGLHAGVGRATITPPVGVDLMGYSRRSRPSTGVHMDLHVTALVLAAAGETIAILDADLIYLHPPLVDEIREAVAARLRTPVSHVLLGCSHSHSAPTSSPVKIGGEQDRVRPEEAAYMASLPGLVLAAVARAQAAMAPARVGAGMGEIGLAVNRREKLADGRVVLGPNPDGPADARVGVLRVDHGDGRPMAAVVNYACHPIFLGSASRLISPDFPGPMRRTVERETGATSLFLQGAAGNVNPRSPMHPDPAEAERAGTRLGLEAAKTFLDVATQPTERREQWITSVATFHLVRDEPVARRVPDRVAAREVRLNLPLAPLPTAKEACRLLEERRAALAALLARGADADDLNPARYQVLWGELLLRAIRGGGPRSVEVPVQALCVNEVGVVAVAGELFVEVQLAIRQASPFGATLVAAYANGCVGYIPTKDAYPDGGYEVEHSYRGYRLPAPIAPGGAEQVAETAIQLLQVLAKDGPGAW